MSTPSTGMKKTLGLTGVTVNAMALIAPGAFLWMTYQLQAASVDASGSSTAQDMWTGIVAALVVAFLTAFAFAELARRYPNAGSGGAYYFAEKAFLEKTKDSHRQWARLAKFVTGWAAHLFYWVYPGVMVAFFAVLVTYIAGQFGLAIPIWGQLIVAWGLRGVGRLYRDARYQRLDRGQHCHQRHPVDRVGGVQHPGDPVPGPKPAGGGARGLVSPGGQFDCHPAQPGRDALPIDHRHPDPGRV